MKIPPSFRPSACLAALALAALPAARATTYTWDGGLSHGNSSTNDYFTQPNNWTSGSAPGPSIDTDLVFTHSGLRKTAAQNIPTAFVLHNLTFLDANDNFTSLTGNGLEFRLNSANIASSLRQSSPTAVTISNPLTLTGDLTVSGDGAGILTLSGAITGQGTLYKADRSTLTLTGTNSFKNGVFVLGGTLAFTAGSTNTNYSVAAQSNGVLAISGSANLTIPDSGSFYADGDSPNAAPGRIIMSGGTVSEPGGGVGYQGIGTFDQSGGTHTSRGTYAFQIGGLAGSQGTYNLSGGTLNLANMFVGDSGVGTFNQNGGNVGVSTLRLGNQASSSGTYNLNGGVLTVAPVTIGGGTGVFNFNGGVLRANGDSDAFFQGITAANVRLGGAVIDSNGRAVTIAQALAHSALDGEPTLDGGLTKLGAGTLTLTGASTFTGGVTIKAGTISVATENVQISPSGPLGDRSGPVTLLGGSLVFTGTTVNTARTYNLGTGTLAPASGGTITYYGGAINGGALGAGPHDVRDTVVLSGTRILGGANLTVGHDRATFNNVLLTGNSTFTLPQSNLLTTVGDLTANPLTTMTLAGTANMAGAYLSGAIIVQSTGRLNGTGGSAAPLYLDGSRGTTINSGGQLNATGNSTIELGGLLTNNGVQTGALNVNLGGVVQGNGTFGTVKLAANSTFGATGTITGNLLVASGATVTLNGGGNTLTVQGALTNNGTLRFTSGASLSVTSGAANFVNNGVIDLISGSASLPAGFTNNGVVLDSSLNRIKTVARAANGSSVTVQIDAYPGHSYKLQRSDSLANGSFADVANVPAQGNAATNATPVTLTFTDLAPSANKGFYRVAIDS